MPNNNVISHLSLNYQNVHCLNSKTLKSSIPSELIVIPNSANVEIIFVKIVSGHSRIYLGSLYIPRPPNVDRVKYTEIIQNIFDLINVTSSDVVIIAGDFNLAMVEWFSDDDNNYVSTSNFAICKSPGATGTKFKLLTKNVYSQKKFK